MMNIRRRSLLFAAVLIACIAVLMNRAFAGPGTAVTGELVETYCWGTLQISGPAHAACGIVCAKRGIPVAVVDRKSRKALVLLPGRDKATLPPALIEAMGQQVTIRGEIFTRGGNQFLTVQSWERVD
jgi:hypothetical protein